MTFEKWWKSYDIWPFDLMDDYEDHPSEYKVKELCKKAYDAGEDAGYEEALSDIENTPSKFDGRQTF